MTGNNPKELPKPKCCEIWMCYLEEDNGSVQGGYRPVLIISNDKNNTYSRTINIIPITSKMNKRKLPVHVELWEYKRFGLRMPSTIMVEQLTTVNVDVLEKRIGIILDALILEMISKAIKVQFPFIS